MIVVISKTKGAWTIIDDNWFDTWRDAYYSNLEWLKELYEFEPDATDKITKAEKNASELLRQLRLREAYEIRRRNKGTP